MIVYRILWWIDLAAIVVIVFILGPEISQEPFDWDFAETELPVILGVPVLLAAAYLLRACRLVLLANFVLLLVAIPAVLFAALLVALSLDPIAFR